jgi:hypothetical protein
MYLHRTLFDHGKEQALSSGALRPEEAVLKVLQDHADAMARETRRDLYDPKVKYQDYLREEEYKKVVADRADSEVALKHSAAEVRQKESELARVPPFNKAKSTWTLVGLTVGFSIPTAMTFHDVIFVSLPDEVLAWVLSAGSGALVSAAVVLAILGSTDDTGERTNWSGLLAGILVSVGLGLLRWSVATGIVEKGVSIGLTILEIGLVRFAEHFAIRSKAAESRHRCATASLEAAKAEYERRLESVRNANEKISGHIRLVTDRDLRNVNLKELIDVAVKAVTDGYHTGIAINRGQVTKAGAR